MDDDLLATPTAHPRTQALKALGNAVVPQQGAVALQTLSLLAVNAA